MKYKLLFTILFSKLSAATVIIGGGPAGLGTAIECGLKGEDVIVIEKRPEYSRDQFLFLIPESIEQLEKWGVELPELHAVEVKPGVRIGFLSIQNLERGLQKRALELGTKIKYATFTGIDPEKKAIFLQESKAPLPYDLLVGADGAHSLVKSSLKIPTIEIGKATGMAALLSTSSTEGVEISPPIQQGSLFARRIKNPGSSLILVQDVKDLSREELVQAVRKCGWEEEALLIEKGEGFISEPIDIRLGHAERFFDATKRAIVVGDAAATASFFQGRGANTAIESAAVVGSHLTQMQKGNFEEFEEAMEKATANLIDHSRFLFEPENG